MWPDYFFKLLKYSLSQLKADLIKEKFGVELPKEVLIRKDKWYIPMAAKLGGLRHFELYGPPSATKESRRKGGLNSIKIHKLRRTNFVIAKTIVRARNNEDLAEVIGAFTSYSFNLLESIDKILKNLGYSPTVSTKLRVLLRREKEVLRFFQEFKPSNPRHYDKLRGFLEEYRSGCNGAASKAAVAVRLP